MTEGTVPVVTPAVFQQEDPDAVRVKLNDLRLRVDAGQEVSPEELLAALRLLHGDLKARAAGIVPGKAKKSAPTVAVNIGKIDIKALLASRVTKPSG